LGINDDAGVKGVNVIFINGLGAGGAVVEAVVDAAGAGASCDGVNL
jgi:hypothetical protein